MKRTTSLIALILVLAMVLTACGGAKDKAPAEGKEPAEKSEEKQEGKEEGKEEGKTLKIGFVTDEGGINDQSFNQGVWEGIQKAKDEFGFETTFVESKTADDYKQNFETMADQEPDVLIAAGFKMAEDVFEFAKKYPEIKVAVVDVDPTNGGTVEAPANIRGLMFKANEPSFLVGYIAGLTSQTNKVGFVGGMESPLILEFDYGYRAGVLYAAKEKGEDIECMVQYVGNFSDAQKGKSIANTMFQNGADVVYHAAGGAGDGVINAAEEQGKWAIGVDRDQNDLAPDAVLTSAMKNANVVVYNLLKDIAENDKFEGGVTQTFGLKDQGAVGIAPTSDKNVAPEVLEKVKGIEEKIVNDEIIVPNTEESFAEFQANLK